MNTEQKRYIFVFTGLLLIFIGGILFLRYKKESPKKNVIAKISSETVVTKSLVDAKKPVVSQFKPSDRPTKLDFAYTSSVAINTQPGLKYKREYLDDYRIVCSGKNCKKQVLASKNSVVINKTASFQKPKEQVIKGNVMFTKGQLNLLKSNVRIVGDLYIKDIDFLRIPYNFKVEGNIHLINSEGLTFMGDNLIDGHIYVSGRGSIRALPKSVKITGQIFI